MQRNLIVSIHQPNYMPWIGYFNKIKQSDLFVFFDDVQFERGKTYTSRTRINNQGIEQWLTVPILGKGNLLDIKDTKCDNNQNWQVKHLKTIESIYKKSKYFNEVYSILEPVLVADKEFIADYNIQLIESILNYLDFDVKCVRSSSLDISNKQGLEKIISILQKLNATSYISGSGAGSKRYIDESQFDKANIKLLWQQFKSSSYLQLKTNEFIPNLSIIDLLFSQGKNSINFL